jgi:EAL domain-containing protein (putative c-di-GMP-specific phosphodiesterase class I)
MQKDSAGQIIALFERYRLSPQTVTIEITEEQAFSNSGAYIIFSSCGILAAYRH